MGYVYVIKMGDTDYHKIGITKNPVESRLMAVQNGNPLKLTVVMLFESQLYKQIEIYLHERLRDFRQEGEWFLVDFSVIAAFVDKSIEQIPCNVGTDKTYKQHNKADNVIKQKVLNKKDEVLQHKNKGARYIARKVFNVNGGGTRTAYIAAIEEILQESK